MNASPVMKPIAPKVSYENPQAARHEHDFKMEQPSPDSVSSSSGNGSVLAPAPTGSRCRRKIAFHPTLGYAIPAPQPAKVARRNARERNRVKQVNSGFEMLREHIPSAAKEKKMSKVDTLRHAVEYIRSLQRMLMEQEQQNDTHGNMSTEHQSQAPPRLNLMSSPPPTQQHQQPISTPYLTPSSEHFQYPSPLTPRTPNTPAAPTSAHPSGEFYQFGNESGYETSSYYSHSSSSLLLSPYEGQQPQPQQQQPQQQQHVQQHPSRPESETSSSSPPAASDIFPEHYGNFYHAPNDENNPEEDELLDVIAKWQDQED